MEEEILNQRKQMLTALMKDPQYRPMKIKELAILLGIPKEKREELKTVLDILVAEGKIGLSSRGKYTKPGQDVINGRFVSNVRGFGFVESDELNQDLFIPAGETKNAMPGDLVQAAVLRPASGQRRAEGRIVKILEHAVSQIVGTYQKSRHYGFVIPDNQKFSSDLFIPEGKSMNAENGQKVVAQILSYGEEGKNPEGEIKEILGSITDPGTDILSIAKAYDIPMDFPPEVLEQLEEIPEEVEPRDLQGRKDLRHLQTVTIDGEDAKDLDDAVTLEEKDGHYFLGVHIADVSHYVKEGTPLDREALKRGTSVYLVDRVIPMLPPRLSNGICSLNEGVDRLVLSCIMELDEKGAMLGHEIAEAVIRSDRRMTYTAVKKILEEEDPEVCREYEALTPLFLRMGRLSSLIRERRRKRGSIDFDFPESKILLNEKGFPTQIKPYERNSATKLIEDFMLSANETIAEDYYWQQQPFLYRVHEKPDEDRIQSFATFINNFGLSLHISGQGIHPKKLQALLDRVENTPEEPLISRLMLRSMKQARYDVEGNGHFGLAAEYYCHFTSPIRRYPDLQIHRIIKENLHGELNEARQAHYRKILPGVALQSSSTERRAEEAERDVEKYKKTQYMTRHLGEELEGVISGVTGYGFYVELPNTVEGMVHVNSLEDDYYQFREESYSLTGEMSGREFKLGQRVRIVVEQADPVLRTIDFRLANSRI